MSLQGKSIAVLVGGPGSEREVSLRSGANVANAIRMLGARVTEVDACGDDFVLPADTELAFVMIHGTYGEDGRIQAELERRGVAYTGEGVAGSQLAIDKIASKRAFAAAGVPTPKFEIIPVTARPTLPLPLVIKAPCEGSSVGVHLCRSETEVAPALADVAKYSQEALVEELIEGSELTVGVLGDQALPIIMIVGSYDYARKYPWSDAAKAARAANPQQQEAQHLCPAPLPAEVTAQVQAAALAATRALNLKVYSRVDLMLQAPSQTPYVLEVNTIPGMTESSLLPEAAAAAGITYPALMERIAQLSAEARA